MLRNLHSGRAQRQHLRPGHQPTASNINGPYPPTGGVNGQTYTCDGTIVNGQYWGGVVFLKSGGVWSLYTHAETHAFDWAPWMTSYKNPILFAHLDTRIPASLFADANASIQNQNPNSDPRVTSLVWGSSEVHNADGGIAFGATSNNGEPGWIQQRNYVLDQDSHGTGVKRAGLAMANAFDPQVVPSFWLWFEHDPNTANGVGQIAESTTDDAITLFQLHGPSTSSTGYAHTDSPYLMESYQVNSFNTGGFHTQNIINNGTWDGTRWHQSDVPSWLNGDANSHLDNTNSGTCESNWRTQLALGKRAVAIKVTWGYGTGRVQAWHQFRGGSVIQYEDYTGNVGPQVSDILGAGGVTTSFCVLKMDWYYFRQRAGWTQIVNNLRNVRVWTNGDTVLSNMGYTTDLARATRMLQSAQSNSTPSSP